MRTLQEKPEASCIDASRMAQDELASVEAKIASLLRLKDELSQMVIACRQGAVADCRVIETLSAEKLY